MAGHLELRSPWTEILEPALRSELRTSIPDGWTIELAASGAPGPRTTYTAWADRDPAKRVYVTRSKDAGYAILEVLQWIHDNETWTLGPYDDAS